MDRTCDVKRGIEVTRRTYSRLVADRTIFRDIVSQVDPSGSTRPETLPVLGSELHESDGVGLHVDSEVDQVHDGVEPRLYEDNVSHHLGDHSYII